MKKLDELSERRVATLQHQISEKKKAGKTVENDPDLLKLVQELDDLTGDVTPAEVATSPDEKLEGCGCGHECNGDCGGDDLASMLGGLGGVAIPIPASALRGGKGMGGLGEALASILGGRSKPPVNPDYDIHSDPLYDGMMGRMRDDLIKRHVASICSEIVNTVGNLNRQHGDVTSIAEVCSMFEYLISMDKNAPIPDSFKKCQDPKQVIDRFRDVCASAVCAEISNEVVAGVRDIVYGSKL